MPALVQNIPRVPAPARPAAPASRNATGSPLFTNELSRAQKPKPAPRAENPAQPTRKTVKTKDSQVAKKSEPQDADAAKSPSTEEADSSDSPVEVISNESPRPVKGKKRDKDDSPGKSDPQNQAANDSAPAQTSTPAPAAADPLDADLAIDLETDEEPPSDDPAEQAAVASKSDVAPAPLQAIALPSAPSSPITTDAKQSPDELKQSAPTPARQEIVAIAGNTKDDSPQAASRDDATNSAVPAPEQNDNPVAKPDSAPTSKVQQPSNTEIKLAVPAPASPDAPRTSSSRSESPASPPEFDLDAAAAAFDQVVAEFDDIDAPGTGKKDLATNQSVTPELPAPIPHVAQQVRAPQAPAQAALPPEVQFEQSNHSRIVSSVHTQLLPNGGTMQIRLDPPELGALQVQISMRDGMMTASFQTSNDDATRLLSHSLTQLKAALESQGVTVEKLQVQQAPREQGGSTTRDGSQSQQQSQQRSDQQDQQRREMLQRMWRRVALGRDPVDLVV